MKMKFLTKTYLLTLILFLIFLDICVFSLVLYTSDNNAKSAEQICVSEQQAIKQAFTRDIRTTDPDNVYLLMVTYTSFYNKKNIYLSLDNGSEVSHSTIPQELQIPEAGHISTKRYGGDRYLLINDTVSTDKGDYTIVYVKDVSYLDIEFKKLAIAFIGISFASSAILAFLLYLILRKLYLPLEKMRKVTEKIADGCYDERADEAGKDEFSYLARDFNRMTDQVKEQMEELRLTASQKQRMLDDLAHEMRTPLTVISGYAEYIRNANISDDERVDATDHIIKESGRLCEISRILLDSAFIRENEISPVEVSVSELILNTKERFKRRASENNIYIKEKATDCTVQGDKILLELLLSNICENAVKACSANGIVTIGCEEQNENTILYVSDNGKGMTAEQLQHVTEPFYRTDKSRSRREGGTGLGLSLCKNIADAHKAKLAFYSKKGEGTKVVLTFPKA